MISAARVIGAAGLAVLWATSPGLGDIAAITSQTAGTLTLVDTDTAEVLSTTPLPGHPAAVSIDAVRDRIMAVAVDTGLLHVFDMAGRPVAQHPVAGAPFGLAIRPETGTALITDQTGVLREIDPDTGAEIAAWPVGSMPSGVAAVPGLIVTADRDADAVTLIRGDGTTALPVGHHPFGVTLHDGLIFTADVLDDTVTVIDPGNGSILARIPTAERPYAVAFAAGQGFVTNQYDSTVTIFDAATFAVTGMIDVGDYPEGIAATADGDRIVVANWFSDTVSLIDTATRQVVAEVDVPEGPRAFGLFIAPTP